MKRTGYRGRVRRPANKKKVEVKVAMGWLFDYAIMGYKYSVATTNLATEYNFIQDTIGGAISRGTGQGDRIGQHIFVKKIVYDIWTEVCPKFMDSPNLTLSANTAGFRVIVDQGRASGTISGYFRRPGLYPFMNLPDRRVFGVHIDKEYFDQAGYPAQRVAGTPGTNTPGLGMLKHRRIALNVNRSVTFDPNTDNTMKNDADVYSLKMIGHYNNMVNDTRYQTHCATIRTRIYYTDD